MYDNLKVVILKSHERVDEIAKALGLSATVLYRRIAGKSKWRNDEQERLREYLNKKHGTNYTIKYLFKKEHKNGVDKI